MHFAVAVTALALAGSVVGSPVVKRNGAENYSVPQYQIRDLEVTIVNIINDLAQLNTTAYKLDYATGSAQLQTLVNTVQGPQSCGPHLPPPPTSRVEAIINLQNSTMALQQLSLDLLDPANTVEANSFNNDICVAKNAYNAQGGFSG
ncbi:hypothetical protein LTR10_002052 [Elasticomyces elasticus]|nr:hypothetical protein LTR10_002052 [Elasticomyces elasticus]KAK4973874.1 hypothetical protein LTR42_005864 [Elasticomyces elasticus]